MTPWWVTVLVGAPSFVLAGLAVLNYRRAKKAEQARDELAYDSEFNKQVLGYLALALSDDPTARDSGYFGLEQLAVGPLATSDRTAFVQMITRRIRLTWLGGESVEVADQAVALVARIDGVFNVPIEANSPTGQKIAEVLAMMRARNRPVNEELKTAAEELRRLGVAAQKGKPGQVY